MCKYNEEYFEEVIEKIEKTRQKDKLDTISTIKSEKILKKIVFEAEEELAVKALKYITDRKIIEKVAFTHKSAEVRYAAISRIDEQILLELNVCPDFSLKTYDQSLLSKLIFSEKNIENQILIASKIEDEGVLEKMIFGTFESKVKAAASKNIRSKEMLYKVALSKELNVFTRIPLIEKIDSQELLGKILACETEWHAQLKLIEKLYDEEVICRVALQRDLDITSHKNIFDEIEDEELLIKIVKESVSDYNKKLALGKIHNQEFLKSIIDSKNKDLIYSAIVNMEDQEILFKIVMCCEYELYVRQYALKKLTNISYLKDIVNTCENETLKYYALKKIENDEKFFEYLAKNSKIWALRYDAIKKIENEDILFEIANAEKEMSVKELAIEKITSVERLIKLKKYAKKNWYIEALIDSKLN